VAASRYASGRVLGKVFVGNPHGLGRVVGVVGKEHGAEGRGHRGARVSLVERFDRTTEEQLRILGLCVDQRHELVFSRLVAGPGLVERRDEARPQLHEQCLGRRPTVEFAVFAQTVEREDRQDYVTTVGRDDVAEVGEERPAVAEPR
jgi:hypothetical protein